MTDAQNMIAQWLGLLNHTVQKTPPPGYAYAGISDFLIQHGQWFNPQPLPATIKRRTIKFCFHNSTQVARRHRQLRYAEGYAVPSNVPVPIHHAWNIDLDGNVIDTTWDKPGLAYFGVAFPVRDASRAINNECTVLDNYKDRRLFETPYPGPLGPLAQLKGELYATRL